MMSPHARDARVRSLMELRLARPRQHPRDGGDRATVSHWIAMGTRPGARTRARGRRRTRLSRPRFRMIILVPGAWRPRKAPPSGSLASSSRRLRRRAARRCRGGFRADVLDATLAVGTEAIKAKAVPREVDQADASRAERGPLRRFQLALARAGSPSSRTAYCGSRPK